jgi:hypothetical protein
MYMGDNKGLKHSWTDTDVMNGKTYYYAVVSYDRGNADSSMYPSECSRVIVQDVNGNLKFDQNTLSVTPQSAAAGYQNGGLKEPVQHVSGFATGNVWIDVLDPLLVEDNQKYRLSFDDTTHADTISYRLLQITEASPPDTIIEESFYIHGEDYNPLFSGMRLFTFADTVEWDASESGWIQGNCNLPIKVDHIYKYPQRRPGYPSSYEIRFGYPDTSKFFAGGFPVNFTVWDIYEDHKVRFALEEPRKSTRDSTISIPLNDSTEYIRIIIQEGSFPREIWRVSFLEPYENAEPILPQDGDILKIQIKTPFRSGDVYEFDTKAAKIDRQQAKNDLDMVAVVPNPYVAAARWEPRRLYASGRGERRIFFIHLPQKCTIRIFTLSGEHVKTIEHDSSMLDGSEPWDLTSKDGLDVAPGVYIFHLDAGEIGEKLGRFALIK